MQPAVLLRAAPAAMVIPTAKVERQKGRERAPPAVCWVWAGAGGYEFLGLKGLVGVYVSVYIHSPVEI